MGEDPKSLAEIKPHEARGEAQPDAGGGEGQPIGKIMTAAREKRSLSQADLSHQAHIPAYYVRMIESDDYALIADQLYLLPFLRRYAAFVGLDPEDVASRFIREVQRADASAARMPEPIPMVEKRPRSWRGAALSAVIGAALAVVGSVAYHYFRQVRDNRSVASVHSSTAPSSSAAPSPSPAAPVASPPASATRPAATARGSAAPAGSSGAAGQ